MKACIGCGQFQCRCVSSIKFSDGKGSRGKWVRSIIATRARDKDGGYHIQIDNERVHHNYYHTAVIGLLTQALRDESPHLGSIRIKFTSAKKPKTHR